MPTPSVQHSPTAALVAAGDMAGFLAEGQDGYLVDARRYALNSASAYVRELMGVIAFDRSINKIVEAHPFMCRERQKEEENVAFLDTPPRRRTIFRMSRPESLRITHLSIAA
jgi:hypothetical protein